MSVPYFNTNLFVVFRQCMLLAVAYKLKPFSFVSESKLNLRADPAVLLIFESKHTDSTICY